MSIDIRPGIFTALGLLAACADAPAADAPALEPEAVRYTLRWSAPDAVRDADALRFTNDLGYAITLRTSYLVTYSVELVPCEQTQQTSIASRAWDAALWLAGAPATAWAGHSGERGENVVGPFIERIGDTEDVEHVAAALPVAPSCKAHYLVGRADKYVTPLADGPDMDRTTLLLTGEYVAPGGGDPVPFTLRTAVANARLDTLDIPVAIDAAPRVTVERRADTLFDGVALADQDEETIMRLILVNLVEDTHITIR
jgi:hypothetical protein